MDDDRTERVPSADLDPAGYGGASAELEARAVHALEALVLDEGPLTIDELAARLSEIDPDLAGELAGSGELVERVTMVARQADELWRLPDGRLAPVLHRLHRATFTHRVSASERARGALDLTPDLVALALPGRVPLVDGAEAVTAWSADDARAADEGSLLVPDGWFDAAGVDVDGLVAVRFDGTVATVEPIGAASLDREAGRTVSAQLAEAFAALAGPRAPEAHRLVVDTIGEHGGAFTVAVPPITELLADAGLAVRDAWVGSAGEAWATPAEQARRRRLDELLSDADPCCHRAARRALDTWHAWMRDGSAAAPVDPSTVDDVAHGPTAALLAEVSRLGRPGLALGRLAAWADTLGGSGGSGGAAGSSSAVGSSGGSVPPGVWYLRALGADAAGDPIRAEELLAEALDTEPTHPACLQLAAELAQDRGDAERAASLLRRTGRPLRAEVERELQPFLVDRSVGRNDPCTCGSGRKFKACCARRPALRPLERRARWLLTRATRHAVSTDPMAAQSLMRLFEVAEGTADALAADMLLFATGGLERYLDRRGSLLAADELACARAWTGERLRLLEVGDHDAGITELVDVNAAATLAVLDAEAVFPAAAADHLVVARPLAVEDRWIVSGVLALVPPSGRQRATELLAGDDIRPLQLLELLVDLQVAAIAAAVPGRS